MFLIPGFFVDLFFLLFVVVGLVVALGVGAWALLRKSVDRATDGEFSKWEDRRKFGDREKKWQAAAIVEDILKKKAGKPVSLTLCHRCHSVAARNPEVKVISETRSSGLVDGSKGKCAVCGIWTTAKVSSVMTLTVPEPFLPGFSAENCPGHRKQGDGHCARCGVHWYQHSK